MGTGRNTLSKRAASDITNVRLDPLIPLTVQECRGYRNQLLAEVCKHVEFARLHVLKSTDPKEVEEWSDIMNAFVNKMDGALRISLPLPGRCCIDFISHF